MFNKQMNLMLQGLVKNKGLLFLPLPSLPAISLPPKDPLSTPRTPSSTIYYTSMEYSTIVWFNSSTRVLLTYHKLCLFQAYNLIRSDVCLYPSNHDHGQDSEHIHHLLKFPLAPCQSLPLVLPLLSAIPRRPTIFWSLPICLYFPKVYTNPIIEYVLFFIWLLSFGIPILMLCPCGRVNNQLTGFIDEPCIIIQTWIYVHLFIQ